MERNADIAIVGGGIAGLAHAYMAWKKGLKVVLFERDTFPNGASVRNFGLVWPVGQEPGPLYDYALRSRTVWQELSVRAGFWLNNNGSLHLAYHDDEWSVLQEFVAIYENRGYHCRLVSTAEVVSRWPAVKAEGLKGGLFSETESTVYARDAIRRLYSWLEASGVAVRSGAAVTSISMPQVVTGNETWRVGKVVICSGADFETLYPDEFSKVGITKCKLQMMRAVPVTPVTLGPTLCAGLTLTHYKAFSKCDSLKDVVQRYDESEPRFRQHGIHVLVSQNSAGELIIGDSHHYGSTLDPFDSEEVNNLILHYLSGFLNVEFRIIERWNGTYPKYPAGAVLNIQPEKNVHIVNGLGGAGMTLSFGIAGELIDSLV